MMRSACASVAPPAAVAHRGTIGYIGTIQTNRTGDLTRTGYGTSSQDAAVELIREENAQ